MASEELVSTTDSQKPDETADPPATKVETHHENPSAVKTKQNGKADEQTRKRWRLPSIFNVPILKILQGTFLILMIGQALPGAEKTFWPFNKKSHHDADQSTGERFSPFYVEMRTDLYGHERQFPMSSESSGGFLNLLLGPKPEEPTLPINTGIPSKQHIVLTHLNREYEAYRYSVRSVTDSKIQAGREFAQASLRRALEKVLSRLVDAKDRHRLTILEEGFLDKAGQMVDKQAKLRASLIDTQYAVFGSHSQCNNSDALQPLFHKEPSKVEPQCSLDSKNSTNINGSKLDANHSITSSSTLVEMKAAEDELSKLISSFLKVIKESFVPGPAGAIRDALQGHLAAYGTIAFVGDLQQTPMRTLFFDKDNRKRLFVTHFSGDIFASDVSVLRKEVTAILRSAKEKDKVLVILQSSGGTVTGYGLVAAQLLRIKDAGLYLTVAVEQVAASGGYLAACVADEIVCSPFAVVGSIGVVQEMPNAYERLKREGIEFHTVTAGEYKRILSPTKQVTPQDLQKAQDELEEVHSLFKEFVLEHRPSLDMKIVGTGEVWFGTKAVELGLCDAIQSADDVLTHFVDLGYDVYRVQYEEPLPDYMQQFLDIVSTSKTVGPGMIQWVLKTIAQMQGKLGEIAMVNGDNNRNRVLLV